MAKRKKKKMNRTHTAIPTEIYPSETNPNSINFLTATLIANNGIILYETKKNCLDHFVCHGNSSHSLLVFFKSEKKFSLLNSRFFFCLFVWLLADKRLQF